VRRALASLAIAVLGAGDAVANPADAFGLGARGAAMGGAQTAASDDTTASYYNPALLATLDDLHIDLGYRTAMPRLEINDRDLGVDSSRGLHVGVATPGRIGGLTVALGSAIFLPDQNLSRVRSLPRSQPRWALYDNRPQRLFFAANLAVAIGERFFVGGGISYMSNTDGAVTLAGRLGFPNAADSDLDLDIDVDLVTIRYPQFGAAAEINDWLDVGVSYRGQFKLVSDLKIRVEGSIGAGNADPLVEDGFLDLRSISEDLFQPAQITAGARIDAGGGWTVSADVGYHRWSRFTNPSAEIELDLELGDFNDLVDIAEQPPLPDPHYSDILVPRIGVEGPLARNSRRTWWGRAGYSWEPSPAPEQIGETNFVDNDKHTASLGVGYTAAGIGEIFLKPISIDVYMALTWLPGRQHQKLSPVDPVGDYRAAGVIPQLGVSSRWRF
jgi:long-chain fatty acid transport protein